MGYYYYVNGESYHETWVDIVPMPSGFLKEAVMLDCCMWNEFDQCTWLWYVFAN